MSTKKDEMAKAMQAMDQKGVDPIALGNPYENEMPLDVSPAVTPSTPKQKKGQGGKWNRATFILDPLIVAKLKVIAGVDQTTVRATVASALNTYLQMWQVSHPYVDLSKIELNPNPVNL